MAWRQAEALARWRPACARFDDQFAAAVERRPYRREARGERKGGDEPSCERINLRREIVQTALALSTSVYAIGEVSLTPSHIPPSRCVRPRRIGFIPIPGAAYLGG